VAAIGTISPPLTSGERAGERLDALGVRFGAALSSLDRDCLDACEPFLAPLRDDACDVLEIGIGSGGSLRTWRAWFRRAHLVGLDVRRIHLDPPLPDCTIVQGDQTDHATLHRVVRDRRVRVVIDDGSRRAGDRIQTFLTLFPWLEPHAVYVCAGLADTPVVDEADHPPLREWFVDLARSVAGEVAAPPRDRSGYDAVVRRARGIYLTRGCAIVTG
jgi:hypothetical protein